MTALAILAWPLVALATIGALLIAQARLLAQRGASLSGLQRELALARQELQTQRQAEAERVAALEERHAQLQAQLQAQHEHLVRLDNRTQPAPGVAAAPRRYG